MKEKILSLYKISQFHEVLKVWSSFNSISDLSIVESVVESMQRCGEYEKGLELLDRVLLESKLSDNDRYRMDRLRAAILIEIKDFGRAKSLLHNCEIFFQQRGEDEEVAYILNAYGIIKVETEQYQDALDLYGKAGDIFQKVGNRKRVAITYYNIGIVYNQLSLYDKALSITNRSIEIFKKYFKDDSWNLSNGLLNLAEIYISKKEYEKAKELLNESLSYAKIGNSPYILSSIYLNLSEIYRSVNNYKDGYQSLKVYFDFLLKGLKIKNIRDLNRVEEGYKLKIREKSEENRVLKRRGEEYKKRLNSLSQAYNEVLGEKIVIYSEPLQEVINIALAIGKNRTTPALITGETGTGKELIAKVVHSGFKSSNRPFITINCSAISSSLFESELFGYSPGAFTGAKNDGYEGKVKIAEGGSLFLDEIGELPLDMQPKLLRFLENYEYYPVGSNHLQKADIKIICATNRDLKVEVDEGRFRRDLYYRLNTGFISIPPLRERRSEIIRLVQFFINKFGGSFSSISNEAEDYLLNYSWPGNVRELRNIVERASLLYSSDQLTLNHLSFFGGSEKVVGGVELNNRSLAEIERDIIERVLDQNGGNISKTAEQLQISRNRLKRKVRGEG